MPEHTQYGLIQHGKLILNAPFHDPDAGRCVAQAEPDYYRINHGLPLRWRYPLERLEHVGQSLFVPVYKLRPNAKAVCAQYTKRTGRQYVVTKDRKLKRGFYIVRSL